MIIHVLRHVGDRLHDIKYPRIVDILQGGKCNRPLCLFWPFLDHFVTPFWTLKTGPFWSIYG